MYIVDVVVAATVLLVSICIILISMVMLRFTINFTMNEEFREIGVMKAIGIKNGSIRILYIVNYMLNFLLALVTIFIVILFCYFCTRNINKISPVSAIRNGGTGERYARKGVINLWKSRLVPVPFMALNDILSKPGRYFSMVLVFTLGILLIIISQ